MKKRKPNNNVLRKKIIRPRTQIIRKNPSNYGLAPGKKILYVCHGRKQSNFWIPQEIITLDKWKSAEPDILADLTLPPYKFMHIPNVQKHKFYFDEVVMKNCPISVWTESNGEANKNLFINIWYLMKNEWSKHLIINSWSSFNEAGFEYPVAWYEPYFKERFIKSISKYFRPIEVFEASDLHTWYQDPFNERIGRTKYMLENDKTIFPRKNLVLEKIIK